jgi:GH24 family phage-related lysozyme (muramidase)
MKTDLWNQNEVKHRQTLLIPKGKKLICIPEIRAWIPVDKSLTAEECEQAKADYLYKYTANLKKSFKHVKA